MHSDALSWVNVIPKEKSDANDPFKGCHLKKDDLVIVFLILDRLLDTSIHLKLKSDPEPILRNTAWFFYWLSSWWQNLEFFRRLSLKYPLLRSLHQ